MLIKCIANKGSVLPEDARGFPDNFTDETEFGIKIGEQYVVYGLTLQKGYVWYFICEKYHFHYPFWYPEYLKLGYTNLAQEKIKLQVSLFWLFEIGLMIHIIMIVLQTEKKTIWKTSNIISNY